MAWYAKVENNIVIDVLYLVDTKDSDWLYREYGGTWLRCAEDSSIRDIFPTVGFTYDAGRDAFVPPSPFASWLYDITQKIWVAPTPMPSESGPYQWDEATASWIAIAA